MKRKEAIIAMVNCYRQCKIMKYSDNQAMDRVLELMEEFKMLAPALPNSAKFLIKNGIKQKHVDNFMKVFKWEDYD